MLGNNIFNWDFCYFSDISDKFTADVDVTYMMTSSCMMMSTLVYFVYYYMKAFVTEMLYNSQNFRMLQYYFHYIIQQLMKMNNFLCKRNFFRETAEKAIFLNYDVINDVMMMQCMHVSVNKIFQSS